MFVPKEKKQILRRKLKLVKNFLFYPKGFITSAQSLLNTGLQQSHLITNTACRTIDPNNQWRVSRKCYKHRSGRTVCGNISVQVLFSVFFYLWNGNSSRSDVQHGPMQNEAWQSYLYQKKLCCCMGRGMNASASALWRAYALVACVRW